MLREHPFHPAQSMEPPKPEIRQVTRQVSHLPDLPDISKADASRWQGIEPEPIKFTIAGLVPEGMTTLLVSEGGAGKSILLQTACTCIPNGLPFLGRETAGGNVAGVFAEDPEAVLHLRQTRINAVLSVDMEALGGRSFIQSYSGLNATLWRDNAPTAFMADLEAQLSRIEELRFVGLDNAALLYSGSENDRLEVTAFVNALNGMAERLKAGIILSTHVSKSADGTALRVASGSTAWVNASRSVLKLENANEPDRATLTLVKANHTKPGEKTPLVWQDGVLVAEPPPDSFEAGVRKRRLEKLVLDKIEEAWNAKSPYSDVPQAVSRYLPSVLARTTDFRVDELKAEMLALQDGGFLTVDQHNSRTPRGLKVARRPARSDYAE